MYLTLIKWQIYYILLYYNKWISHKDCVHSFQKDYLEHQSLDTKMGIIPLHNFHVPSEFVITKTSCLLLIDLNLHPSELFRLTQSLPYVGVIPPKSYCTRAQFAFSKIMFSLLTVVMTRLNTFTRTSYALYKWRDWKRPVNWEFTKTNYWY